MVADGRIDDGRCYNVNVMFDCCLTLRWPMRLTLMESTRTPQRAFRSGFAVGVLAVVLFAVVTTDVVAAQNVRSNTTVIDPDAAAITRATQSGTEIEVPAEIRGLIDDGGVPKTLSQLRLMERQQRRVARLAAACTVSVQIGPAQGCGVIITPSGYVLTAAHVAMRPDMRAIVTTSDGRELTATTLGLNRNYDAGLLKINRSDDQPERWPHATAGTSEGLVPGMWCVAMGHPGGFDPGRGPVTRVGRILEARPDALLTDCALIGGDSGGPLFDYSGRLIAVHSRIGNDVAENLHVPVDKYASSWKRMRRGDSWGVLAGFRPSLGVRGNTASEPAVITSVAPGSVAAQNQIQPGDIVEKFNGADIRNFAELKQAVSDTMPGERVRLKINRDGDRFMVTLEIGRGED